MEPGYEIKVLDHGYVRFIESMGSDEGIVEAARMSTGRGFVSWEPYRRCKRCDFIAIFHKEEKTHMLPLSGEWRGCASVEEHDWQDFPRGDLGMLEFMYMNKHSTPFEFADVHIEVLIPLMAIREWQRHRQQSYSEFSARYSQMPDLHYVPELSRIQKQSATNRQGSGEAFNEEQAGIIQRKLRGEQGMIYATYDDLVEKGLAKEVARLNTPVSRYSKMRAKTDLRNWLAFLQLRMAPAAQWEIRQYANRVAEIIKALYPRTYALFEEHDLHGVRLSRSEAEVLARLVDANKTAAVDFNVRKAALAKLGVKL